MFQQRSWLLSREGHGQRIAARALHMDFLASVINDDECWKCVHMHVFFLFLFFEDSVVHSFLGESEIASQGLSMRRWGMKPLVRILCKIQSFSTILFIY